VISTISNGEEPIVYVDTLEEIEPAIQRRQPGRWQIDEFRAKPFPSGHTSRRWGVGIKLADASVVIEPHPSDA
jgi:hypothetical protein